MNTLRAPLGDINLKKALVLSVLLHALLLLVHFSKPQADTAFSRPLEVILVNAQSQKTPNDAKVLAQVALDGGGQADKGRATTLPGQAEDKVNQRELIAQALQPAVRTPQRYPRSMTMRLLTHRPAMAMRIVSQAALMLFGPRILSTLSGALLLAKLLRYTATDQRQLPPPNSDL